jgi:hypothetical protein
MLQRRRQLNREYVKPKTAAAPAKNDSEDSIESVTIYRATNPTTVVIER